VAILALVGVVVAVVQASDDVKAVPATWAIGSCVEQEGDEPQAVRCDGPHDGRIVGVDDRGPECPEATDAFVAGRGYIWCVDTDR
jgi:hypothetical protein